ncbi:unnamed protein product [Closterium sp. NIES-65]|nr:unnamed protein product [Closterium sp. NIES-65]
MEADLTNMIDIEIRCAGNVLGTVVIDKEWSLSAVRTEIFAVFPGTAPEEFEFWIHGPDAPNKSLPPKLLTPKSPRSESPRSVAEVAATAAASVAGFLAGPSAPAELAAVPAELAPAEISGMLISFSKTIGRVEKPAAPPAKPPAKPTVGFAAETVSPDATADTIGPATAA